jgi:hypothetical protein
VKGAHGVWEQIPAICYMCLMISDDLYRLAMGALSTEDICVLFDIDMLSMFYASSLGRSMFHLLSFRFLCVSFRAYSFLFHAHSFMFHLCSQGPGTGIMENQGTYMEHNKTYMGPVFVYHSPHDLQSKASLYKNVHKLTAAAGLKAYQIWSMLL